jgi:hypothetical protein
MGAPVHVINRKIVTGLPFYLTTLLPLWLWACFFFFGKVVVGLWPAASQASPPEMATGQWGRPRRQQRKPICLRLLSGRFPFVASAREHEEPPRRFSFSFYSTAEHDRLRSHLALSVSSAFHTVLVPAAGSYHFLLDLDPTDSHRTNLDGRFHSKIFF